MGQKMHQGAALPHAQDFIRILMDLVGFSYILNLNKLTRQSREVITWETQLSQASYSQRKVLKIKISSTTSLIDQSFAGEV